MGNSRRDRSSPKGHGRQQRLPDSDMAVYFDQSTLKKAGPKKLDRFRVATHIFTQPAELDAFYDTLRVGPA